MTGRRYWLKVKGEPQREISPAEALGFSLPPGDDRVWTISSADDVQCETIVPRSGLKCTWQAKFTVGIGTRRSDRQLACPRHLGLAAEMALIAEDRPGAVVTVELA